MAKIDPIKIQGLAEFNRSLRKISSDLPKELRLGLNKGAQLIVDYAQPRVPSKSGKARRSVRASSTRTAAQVTGGGKRVAYYPFLDFGGRVGPKRSVHRPFIKSGRYIYAGYNAKRKEFHEVIVQALLDVAESAGIQVERGS